ncbi:hydroxymethylglutaryl-CoA lyase [Sinobaca qinghaiensis]|uniref:Hydroxymethylglutaryl-CoA lyase n=1 Tax=Sinobaca qinghaiensis TaxID=342944 RepID=A0A419V8B7_9BACL|nr:hydroxymethylglutaryl-CoA lyase [Sinobaca qinghaiensis]RKD76198.1 hydroxymethylglutaryl-CoA lyase [Sinobaca qinghaiensis]
MIELCEVGPRDGIQNEKVLLTTGQKVEMIERAIGAGVRKVEAVSFVNPKVVPQMADAEIVVDQLEKREGTEIAGLVLSASGIDRALSTSIDRLHATLAVSDTFNKKNARRTTKEGIQELTHALKEAKGERPFTAVLATSFGCPYEGEVTEKQVIQAAQAFVKAGADSVVLADTTGMANPISVKERVASVQKAVGEDIQLGLHFHNTRGLGLANVFAGYEAGIIRFDASVGGLGGCPFAPNAVGNVSSEDMIHMFEEMGVPTGVDLDKMIDLARQIEYWMGKPLDGMVMKAGKTSELAKA